MKERTRIGLMIFGIGLLIMAGSVGAAEAQTFSLWQTVIGAMVGLIIGWIGAKILEA